MIHGIVPPLRPLCPFPLIAGLLAHWYEHRGTANSARRLDLQRVVGWFALWCLPVLTIFCVSTLSRKRCK